MSVVDTAVARGNAAPTTSVSSHHNLPVGSLSGCQVCAATDLELVLDLGYHAPCDSLLRQDQLREVEKTYPLRFLRCRHCGLAQIDYVADPRELFYPEYPYRSGITETLSRNLQAMTVKLCDELNLARGSLVVDIGSNDGTLLQGFKSRGMKVLGVEPTNIAKIAVEHGIQTIQDFFCEALAKEIRAKHGGSSIVTAANMFAHVASLGELIRGVRELLVDGGLFLTESHYLLDLLQTVQYDSIYHEHLKYYALKPLTALLRDYQFTIVDAERIPNYGGSIRVYAKKGTGHPASRRLCELLETEEREQLYSPQPFAQFRERTIRSKLNLQALLVDLKRRGKRVVGIGCPGRASTLLNYCSIDPDLLPYIAEQSSSLKLGLFLPGKHIPIVDERIMFEENPDYAVILSWHYAQPIIAKLRQKGLRSKLILPLPEVRVLED